VRASVQTLAALGRQLLLCYTGSVRRNVGLIDRQIQLHRQGREDTILGMKRLQEMAFAMRHAIERGDIDVLGSLLDDAFVAKKQMNPFIAEHTPIEEMLAAARSAGAIGGKICGAGGGGYLLLAAPPSAHQAIRDALERSGGQFASFAFSSDGVRARRGGDVWAPSA
jgi:D-glycero-alpha-D-manno-heptose-7-phosphate kinase